MTFRAEHFVPFPRSDVWDWHTRPGAMERLIPPFIPMRATGRPSSLATGTSEFALPGGLRWVARHDLSGYHSGIRFTDVCVNAPLSAFAQWRHVHEFRDEVVDGIPGTVITDTVSTRIPSGFLDALFAYRQRQLLADLQRLAATPSERPLRIGMTGSTGLVGSALSSFLRTAGHEVVPLVRGKADADAGERHWRPVRPSSELLDELDALVHLAGEPIAGRFSRAHKKKILDSRTIPTRRLAEMVATHPTCRTMVVASGVGFYGPDRNDEILLESSERGDSFLAEVVEEWEAACDPARKSGARVVTMRCGIVLAGNGGLLPGLRTAYLAGLRSSVGREGGYVPWIGIDDIVGLYARAVCDSTWNGIYNAVAPQHITSEEFGEALARAMHRRFTIPIPGVAPRLALGSDAIAEIIRTSQRVVPTRALDEGYSFTHTEVLKTLKHQLGDEELLNNVGGTPFTTCDDGEK